MSIAVHCKHCETSYEVEDQFEGKKINCLECMALITAESAESEPETGVQSAEPHYAEPRGKKKMRSRRKDGDDDDENLFAIAKKPARKSKTHKFFLWAGGMLGVLFMMCMGLGIFVERDNKNALAYMANMTNTHTRVDMSHAAVVARLAENLEADVLPPNAIRDTRAAYQDLQTTMNSVRDDMKTWYVPWSTNSLHAGYLRLFQCQEDAVQKYGQIIEMLENGALSREQKRDQGNRILDGLDVIERDHFSELQSLQQACANSHGIRLVGPPRPVQPRFIHPFKDLLKK